MRTGSDRLAEIQGIFDAHFTARLRGSLTPAVIKRISDRPLGPHDDQSARVVRALANAPVAGKYVVLSLGPDGPWGIARIVIGREGNIDPLEGTYTSYEEAMRQIFLKRIDELVSEWAHLESDGQEKS
ncbi:MAG: hypothetical protein ABI130_09210 [Leifsonia sp.]